MHFRWKLAQRAEIHWWRFYLKKKDREDYLERKKKYWYGLQSAFGIRLDKKERVLDAGCGPAGIFIVLKDQLVDAVDPLLGRYAGKLRHFVPSDYPHVCFYSLPLEQFVIGDPYDKVYCHNAINHVSDLNMCFDQLAKATKSGGQLLIAIDTHKYPFFKMLFRLFPADILHPHQYDLSEYQNMLRQRGYAIEKIIRLKKGLIFDYHAILAIKQF